MPPCLSVAIKTRPGTKLWTRDCTIPPSHTHTSPISLSILKLNTQNYSTDLLIQLNVCRLSTDTREAGAFVEGSPTLPVHCCTPSWLGINQPKLLRRNGFNTKSQETRKQWLGKGRSPIALDFRSSPYKAFSPENFWQVESGTFNSTELLVSGQILLYAFLRYFIFSANPKNLLKRILEKAHRKQWPIKISSDFLTYVAKEMHHRSVVNLIIKKL